jgi:RNA-directed DNA polymerase
VNIGPPIREFPVAWVSQIQAKLHRWAAADPGRRFDDLFNLVCDPATLMVAWDRVAANRGARSAGSDGLTVATITARIGIAGFLDDLRQQLRAGTFCPQPVRERMIPKPGGSGKLRRLGIPTVTDRVVQAALKLVLEPIFEADFLPVSYGCLSGGRMTRSLRYICSAPRVTAGCSTPISKRVSTGLTTPRCWRG